MIAMSVLAVDIGGTKLAAGLVDPDGTLHHDTRVDTPPGGSAEELFAALAAGVGAVLDAADRAGLPAPDGVGIGSASPMRWPVGEISPLNIPGWREFPVRARLASLVAGRLGRDVPVRIHNDAVCTAIGEHWRGGGRGHDNLIGMVVSTGVGGGLILAGRTVDGASGNAGHIGHIVVEPDSDIRCGCGGYGCLEATARGPAIVEWAVARGWAGERTGKALAAAAARGDGIGIAAFERCGWLVGLGVASAVNLLDVTKVVIGGGMAQAGALMFDSVHRAYAKYARLTHSRGTEIAPAELGGNAGLIGAAALVLGGDRYWSRG
jgi:glucokinase